MRWIIRTLYIQVFLLWATVLGVIYYDTVGFAHRARLFGIAYQTIMHPRVKSAETDAMVRSVGRARLATELYGSWLEVGRLKIVRDVVRGDENYVAVYIDPETGKEAVFSTFVRWQVMGERFHVDLEPWDGSDVF